MHDAPYNRASIGQNARGTAAAVIDRMIESMSAKPAEAKPAEAKPAEAKPAEAKPAELDPHDLGDVTGAGRGDRGQRVSWSALLAAK
jgi:hypothetical protein